MGSLITVLLGSTKLQLQLGLQLEQATVQSFRGATNAHDLHKTLAVTLSWIFTA